MNKLVILLALGVLLSMGVYSTGISHASSISQIVTNTGNLTSNTTLQNNTRTTQENETALMTSQLVGYNKEYQLYVTVPGNNQNYTQFIQTFYLNVTSQGPSAVTVYEGESSIYTRQFDWAFDSLNAPHGLITINKTGHIMLTVQLHSYQTNLTRNVIYLLNFENTTTFVTYYNQQVNKPASLFPPVSSGEFFAGVEVIGIVGVLSVGAAIARRRSSKKGWQMHPDPKKQDVKKEKKNWWGYFGFRNQRN